MPGTGSRFCAAGGQSFYGFMHPIAALDVLGRVYTISLSERFDDESEVEEADEEQV